MKRLTSAVLVVAILSGCATAPPPTYTPTAVYQGLDCTQLAVEAMRIDRAAQTQLASKSSKDVMTGVAVVAGALLFWPALFFIQSTAGEDIELNRLRADADAVKMSAVLKKCDIPPMKATEPPPPPIKPAGSCVTGTSC